MPKKFLRSDISKEQIISFGKINVYSIYTMQILMILVREYTVLKTFHKETVLFDQLFGSIICI